MLSTAVVVTANLAFTPGTSDMRLRYRELVFWLCLCCVQWTAGLSRAAGDEPDLRTVVENYSADHADVLREYGVPNSPIRGPRFEQLYRAWESKLAEMAFDGLSQSGKIDYLLLANHIQREERQLRLDEEAERKIAPLAPFLSAVAELETGRRRYEFVEGQSAAGRLTELTERVAAAKADLEKQLAKSAADKKPKRTDGRRAAMAVAAATRTLRHWYDFYHGYDPSVSWWIESPYKKLNAALEDYARILRTRVAGLSDDDKTTVLGIPIGRAGLESELAAEMIPYDPDRLLAIADREMAWCEKQMIAASRDLGYGDDWKKALEHVKQQYVPPGGQPALIRQLTDEAIQFVEVRDLVTIPPLAKETMRMEMMTPERHRVNPFFTGGDTISVSFPTSDMSHEEKLMTLRGNNRYFARATVFHELIPGHRLQEYVAERSRPYRSLFETPFWIEGWALYWEMQMWDLKFPRTPEERIGMLFWRMHRCARITFSLKFHLGQMSAQECIDYLVDRVGHERDNAAGEVRRSFESSYSPLYQAAYMLGGLQLRALYRELVTSGKMTPRAFHDAVLQENSIPIEMIRASLTHQPLTRDYKTQWRFDD
jgi:uncharacterized protein (DUF885 family)